MSDRHTGAIFLIGMMGAGKSTVGRRLADALALPFIDLDTRIERVFGISIEDSFAAGEEGFRELESAALLSLAHEPALFDPGCVVATGGGAAMAAVHRRFMAERGRRVYLKVGIDALCARLADAAQRRARPLVAHGQDLRATLCDLLEQRRSVYEECETIVDAEASAELVTARLLESLGRRPAVAPSSRGAP